MPITFLKTKSSRSLRSRVSSVKNHSFSHMIHHEWVIPELSSLIPFDSLWFLLKWLCGREIDSPCCNFPFFTPIFCLCKIELSAQYLVYIPQLHCKALTIAQEIRNEHHKLLLNFVQAGTDQNAKESKWISWGINWGIKMNQMIAPHNSLNWRHSSP